MVAYIKSDLEFILAQIKISEQHAAGTPLFGPGGLVPAYNLSMGLRTVDGTYNNLLPGQERWGAADIPFPEPLGTNFRPATSIMVDFDGPGGMPAFPTATSYAPSTNPNSVVADGSIRTISNLIVDQTMKNPAAIVTALERAGSADPFGDLVIVQNAAKLIITTTTAATAAQAAETAAEAAVGTANAAQLIAQAAYEAALANNGAAVAALAAASDDAAAAADNAVADAAAGLFLANITAADLAALNVAVAAALAAANAAAAVVGALSAGHAELADAQSVQANAALLHTQLVALQGVLIEGQSPMPHLAAIFTATTLADANVAPAESLTADLNALVDPGAVAAALAALEAANAAQAAAVAEEAAAEAASVAADAAAAAAVTGLAALLADFGIEFDGQNISLPNIAPDGGLSASFNSWFTLFGQFFDHGLDLVGKGGSGTVYIPLQPDDPLYVQGGHTNFMVLTRATVTAGLDNVLGDDPLTVGVDESLDDVRPINTTTSFVDQNQTYTSHSSHQVFLREYVLDAAGHPVATGKLIQGDNGGMATWGELKIQAKEMLGITLTDADVGNVPLLRTDQYGNFIPGPNGFPQVITGIGVDGIPNTADDVTISGTPNAPVGLANAVRIGHAFLADIAHTAVPTGLADGDIEIGLSNPGNEPAPPGSYDNELLDAHFIAGDGRVNENIGLTAVHHVFHAEHNRLVEHTKAVILATGDNAFIQEWLVEGAVIGDGVSDLEWNGERLFQAAKFGTEMQYQHLVFEEFARKIQPQINPFVVPDGYDVTINPSIVAEFAHVVYRFGHSMLTETIDRFDPSFNAGHIGLIEGFLNPFEFDEVGGTAHGVTDEVAAGAIIRGMTRQVGNEIDEFVTSALRNNLLGLPLDLATINLARGRDTGVPSLNAARREFFEVTNSAAELKPYESWVEFAGNLKHEASIINFIAAYGNHALITGETTIDGKRDAALTLITGQAVGKFADMAGFVVPTDAEDFLNGTGAYGAGNALGGLENVDLWIGGLAEKILPFGGMLGSTFNFVFEVSLEQLQNGDRFYYLQRLDGLHLFGEMEANSFAAMIMRNTDATHLPSDVFSVPGLILEVDRTKQYNPDLGEEAGVDGILLDNPDTVDVDESADNLGNDPQGGGILTPLVIRNNPATAGPDANYLRYTGDQHVVLGGTSGNDILIASEGDDTLHGDAGNDYLEGGAGNDVHNGGDGDDIIKDLGGDDNIKGGAGNDVINSGPGLDLVLGGSGKDFVFLGNDAGGEVFGGEGDDFIYGNKNAERLLGNEGNDWLETGTFDGAPGDNFDEIFARDGVVGHDVFLGDGGFDEFIGEGGDDIMVGSPGRGKMAGMSGWDWVTYKDNTFGVDADLTRGIVFDEFPNPPVNGTLDAYESVEGVSGTRFNDILTGADTLAEERLPAAQGGSEGYTGSAATAESMALVSGLQALLGAGVTSFSEGDILLGGDGSDRITGRAGDDIIDGDKWLNVRISVRQNADGTGPEIASHNSMTTLAAAMFAGTYNPGQLVIVREILSTGDTTPDIDTAVYQGLRTEYTFAGNEADLSVRVTHAIEDSLDGSDKLRNIERVEFAGGDALGLVVGTNGNDVLNGSAGADLMFGMGGNDSLNAGAGNDILVGGSNGAAPISGTASDNFGSQTLSGGTGWASAWQESNDSGGVGAGQIRIDAGGTGFNDNLSIVGGTPAASFDGAQIQRTVNLAGATTATLNYTVVENSLDSADNDAVTVSFSRDGITFVTIETVNNNTNNPPARSYDLTQFGTGPFTANAAIRITSSALGTGDSVTFDNLSIAFSTAETLNGGLGDDTYVINLGDGNDIINEAGGADRITVGGSVPPALPLAFTGLTVLDAGGNDLAIQINSQQVTINDHFDTAGEAVEFINFNGSTFEGYVLAGDYALSTDDGGDREAAAGVNTILAGSNGGNTLIGNTGFDLLFGNGAGDTLQGGLGEDLLVGGAGNDLLDGGNDLDTLVGGADNDTYIDDTGEDIIVEQVGGGTDTIDTLAATYTLVGRANVENLTYSGADADPFVGTGNELNNRIEGGDLDDVLDGGLGTDTLVGGLGNDTYIVDNTGDIIDEDGDEGIDQVNASASYTLSADVENLTLVGAAAINGTGNALANEINGNGADNQLFGGGGDDDIDGGDGVDLIDGGTGNDILSGGAGGDADIVIGGAGNDTIDVGSGNDIIRYTAEGFGNDEIINFDATGGSAATQDLIDLSALGVTAANFATRVTIQDVVDAGTDDTNITVRNAAGATIGTIFVQEVDGNDITISDFLLGTAVAPLPGATNAANILTGTAGNDTIIGLQGNDTIDGAAGDDTIIWNANAADPTDGRDLVNGGAEGLAGDTFVLNGRAAVAETYRIYTRQAFDDVPGNNLTGIDPLTEIIVTRNGTNAAAIIAELREIEEIRINGFDPAGNATLGGDTIQVIGNFAGTSLRLNTITIDGDAGDDTIDISALTSAHRIVFKSNGGNDTIIGALQAEDVIELPEGADVSTYTLVENENGTKTISNGSHSVTFTGVVPPQFQTTTPGGEEPNDDETPPDDTDDTGTSPVIGGQRTGTPVADVLTGTEGDDTIVAFAGDDIVIGNAGADAISAGEGGDFVSGGDGRDVIFAGAGDDQVFGGGQADVIYGDAGADRIFGDQGNDLITGGAGDDTVFGGEGDDLIVAEAGDGNDVYFGDEGSGGTGIDTLDISAATANVTVNLGSGPLSNGTASSSQTGNDTIWGIENVNTGSGNDTIIASNAVNVMNGGAGDDTYRFTSASAADGDTVLTFEAGDRVDLTAIDANLGAAGDQSFSLVSGAFTAAGQLAVTFETRADGDYTVVQGNIDGDADAEFAIEISGHQNLNNSNLGL